MNDLISRAAALDAIDGMKPMRGNMEQLAMKALCWAAVKSIPAVDAVPVVHAYWVAEPDRVNHWHCSNCGCPVGIASIAYRYCYVCGAKMAEHPRAADGCGQAFSPD